MNDISESLLRLSLFLSIFVLMAMLETIIPKRALLSLRQRRWFNNLSLMLLGSLFVRLTLPLSMVAIAHYVSQRQMGLLYIVDMSFWVKIVLSVLILDLVIYIQHRLFHTNNFLWRFHQTHHSDKDMDVTTAVRFHPIEIWISALIKMATVLFLGTPALAILLFEIILSSMALFNHSNIYIPPKLDKFLRFFVVTPNMHRIHHSIKATEMNSNYGFSLSLWDKLFSTYCRQPQEPYKKMTLGLVNYKDKHLNLKILLIIPFIRRKFKQK